MPQVLSIRRRKSGSSTARLAPEQAKPQSQIARAKLREMLGEHAFQHGGIGGRAGDRSDAEFVDGSDQKLRLADPERHDSRASRLQRRVVGVAAHPQPVVQAMHDAIAGSEARRRLRTRADHRGFMRVPRRQREVHCRARGARGSMNPRHTIRWRGEVIAERRMGALAFTQRLLVDQRQVGQGIQPPRRHHAGPGAVMQRGIGNDIIELSRPTVLAVCRKHIEVGEICSLDQHGMTMSGAFAIRTRPSIDAGRNCCEHSRGTHGGGIMRIIGRLAFWLLIGLLGSWTARADTLAVCTEASPDALNAQLSTANTSFDVSEQIADRLVEMKIGGSDLVPGLAQSWTISEDGLTYTFKLRHGVKFQSNADFKPTRDFNADDVVFSFRRMFDKSDPFYQSASGNFPEFVDLVAPSLAVDRQDR